MREMGITTHVRTETHDDDLVAHERILTRKKSTGMKIMVQKQVMKEMSELPPMSRGYVSLSGSFHQDYQSTLKYLGLLI